ncbi:hypothetical protein Gotur_031840, partial [Gossypium turneri]
MLNTSLIEWLLLLLKYKLQFFLEIKSNSLLNRKRKGYLKPLRNLISNSG